MLYILTEVMPYDINRVQPKQLNIKCKLLEQYLYKIEWKTN